MSIPSILPPSASQKPEGVSQPVSLTPPDTLPSTLRLGQPINPSVTCGALTSGHFPPTAMPSEDEKTQFLNTLKSVPRGTAAAMANAIPLVALLPSHAKGRSSHEY